MQAETLHILEYERIQSMLAKRTHMVASRELASRLQPASDLHTVQELLAETEEAEHVLSIAPPPMGGIFDLRPIVQAAKMGAVLELDRLAELKNTLYSMRVIKHFFKESEIEAPILKGAAHSIEILGQLERSLENIIDEHGAVREDASVELRHIKRELRRTQNQIKERINGYLHGAEYQKYLQDSVTTIRDDRYVLLVKREYRKHFPGIVHDQSATGATLFIEPLAVLEMNNDVKQLKLQEHQEIQRLLRLLTTEVMKNRESLLDNLSLVARMDLAFAKARLALDMHAIKPLVNDKGVTVLHEARHPLIDETSVVPISIELGRSYRLLLVTGPNTGGKTVTMKTVGLLSLMAQSGCYIPAATDSEISIYRNIYADIGDDQSISQNLSTFSAHITHLHSILSQATSRDLLLLDEIGAGTDPEEGAALAMAMLERMLQIGCMTIATTHYSQLKAFALSQEGVENACVEFDMQSLRPTYRLLIGFPGASNAFAISKRLGLPEELIHRAKNFLSTDHAQLDRIIGALEAEKKEFEEKNRLLLDREQEIERVQRKVEQMQEELSKKKENVVERAREQSRAILNQTRRESEEIIKNLKLQFNDMGIRSRQQAIQDARKRLKASSERIAAQMSGNPVEGCPIDIKALQIGDMVFIRRLNQKGTVQGINGQELLVQLGGLHTTIKADECMFVCPAKKASQPVRAVQRNLHASRALRRTAATKREIDIRGLMVNEAESVLDKFIDDAVMAGLSEILIIHGKGTGALRKGIHEYLKRHRSVTGFSFAEINEGGTGATVVALK